MMKFQVTSAHGIVNVSQFSYHSSIGYATDDTDEDFEEDVSSSQDDVPLSQVQKKVQS